MKIGKHFESVVEALNLVDQESVEEAIKILREVGKSGRFVWIVGNGGSAATASHFANDLVKMCHIRAVSIADMTPLTLANGNDYGWEHMFANPVRELSDPMDVVVAISCSGNSKNVVAAIETIRYKCQTIALTGPAENSLLLQLEPTVAIRVMADEIRVMEDVHSIICHAIAGAIRDER